MIRHSHEEMGLFTVWQESVPASNASFYAASAKQAAEAKAREDWSDGHDNMERHFRDVAERSAAKDAKDSAEYGQVR